MATVKRLKGCKCVFLDLARLRGWFQYATWSVPAKNFEDAEEVAGEGGMMCAVGHGEQHVAVNLQRRETHRQPGIALATRDRPDTRAHLLGDTGAAVEA